MLVRGNSVTFGVLVLCCEGLVFGIFFSTRATLIVDAAPVRTICCCGPLCPPGRLFQNARMNDLRIFADEDRHFSQPPASPG